MKPHRYPGLFSDPRNRGLWMAIGLSALLHSGLMMAFGRFHIRPVERTFYAPMHMVDLVEPLARPGPKQGHARASAPAKAPPLRPKPKTTKKAKSIPAAKPAPKKTVPAPTHTLPAEPEATPEIPAKVLEERLSQRIAHMRQQAGQDPAAAPAEPPGASRGQERVEEAIHRIRQRFDEAVPGGAGTSGAIAARPTGNVMEQVRVRAYYNQVWAHVNDHWTIPPGVRGKDLSVIISTRIDRQGGVLTVVVEVPSGSEAFDRSALQALQRAEPLPAVPAMIPDATLEIGFRFHGE